MMSVTDTAARPLRADARRNRDRLLDAAVHASVELGQFELRLSGRYTRIFYSLHPLPYDPYIAGGALDELFAVDLAFGLRL